MIIGIAGKKQSGKDTVGKIIQFLTVCNELEHFKRKCFNENGKVSDYYFNKYIAEEFNIIELHSYWKTKKFADKLKDMVCMLIGCTREQLEDETFKNTELEEEWWCYKTITGLHQYKEKDKVMNSDLHLIKLTPRLLLQLLGTDGGRDIIHPNIWVNSTTMTYDKSYSLVPKKGLVRYGDGYATEEDYKLGEVIKFIKKTEENSDKKFERWIITDCRFPNEAESISNKGGIVIRVNSDRCNNEDKHPSETALDDYEKFNYVIENNGTLEELLYKVRDILTKEGLLL